MHPSKVVSANLHIFSLFVAEQKITKKHLERLIKRPEVATSVGLSVGDLWDLEEVLLNAPDNPFTSEGESSSQSQSVSNAPNSLSLSREDSSYQSQSVPNASNSILLSGEDRSCQSKSVSNASNATLSPTPFDESHSQLVNFIICENFNLLSFYFQK